MGFSLWNLLKACVLVINALALLHPHRFLKNCEWRGAARWRRGTRKGEDAGRRSTAPSSPRCVAGLTCFSLVSADGLDKVNEGTGVKQQIAGMLHAARFMRCELRRGTISFAAVTEGQASSLLAFVRGHFLTPAVAVFLLLVTITAGPLVAINSLIILVELLFG